MSLPVISRVNVKNGGERCYFCLSTPFDVLFMQQGEVGLRTYLIIHA